MIDRNTIREVFMKHGFTIKDGQTDLKPYVFAAAEELIARAAPAMLNAEEMAALRRFDECAQDGEGWDVPKAMMQRLAEIGVVQRRTGNFYQATAFGQHVLGHTPTTCEVPPTGWYCTRAAGHDGACAAHPVIPDGALINEGTKP